MSYRSRKLAEQYSAMSAVVLSNESPELYAQIRAAYFDRLRPADQVEADLVDRIVSYQWRLQRTAAMETAAINMAMSAGAEAVAGMIGEVDGVTRAVIADPGRRSVRARGPAVPSAPVRGFTLGSLPPRDGRAVRRTDATPVCAHADAAWRPVTRPSRLESIWPTICSTLGSR